MKKKRSLVVCDSRKSATTEWIFVDVTYNEHKNVICLFSKHMFRRLYEE